MSEIDLKLSIEPKNPYEKARKAIFDALKAANSLTKEEQAQLFNELMQTAALANSLEAFITMAQNNHWF